jgi:hypothetical protein
MIKPVSFGGIKYLRDNITRDINDRSVKSKMMLAVENKNETVTFTTFDY